LPILVLYSAVEVCCLLFGLGLLPQQAASVAAWAGVLGGLVASTPLLGALVEQLLAPPYEQRKWVGKPFAWGFLYFVAVAPAYGLRISRWAAFLSAVPFMGGYVPCRVARSHRGQEARLDRS